MCKNVVIVFFAIAAAWDMLTIAEAVTTTAAAKTKNCTQSTGYKYTLCGAEIANQVCCKANEACVGPVKPHTGKDMYVCSAARQLTGKKAISIVARPFFLFLMDVAFVVFMVSQLDIKGSHVPKLCVAVIAVSWPLYLSQLWATGCWAAFLAVFVAYVSTNLEDFPWYAYRLTWVLQIFMVVALFGPLEAFHVPLFGHSKASASTELIKNAFTSTSLADCDSFYDSYYTLLGIEKKALNADPDLKYYGLCTKEWLATVQVFCLIQGILWMVLAIISARDLLKSPFNTVSSFNSKEAVHTA